MRILILVLSFLIGHVYAQSNDVDAGETLYKWTDAEGIEHYSATPPEGVGAEKIDLQDANLSTIPAELRDSEQASQQSINNQEQNDSEQNNENTRTIEIKLQTDTEDTEVVNTDTGDQTTDNQQTE